VLGTVVTVTELDVVGFAVPAAFVPTTVNVYDVPPVSPVNVYDVFALPVVTVDVAGFDVIVYEVAAGEVAGSVQERLTAPLPNGLFVPTFVADKLVTASGCKKLSCAEDLVPLLFETAMLFSFFLY